MKYVLFVVVLMFSVIAYAESPDSAFMNSKAGVFMGQKIKFKFKFADVYSKSICTGRGISCQWEKLEGNGRYRLDKTIKDEISGEKNVLTFVIEKGADGYVYVMRTLYNKQDLGLGGNREVGQVFTDFEAVNK